MTKASKSAGCFLYIFLKIIVYFSFICIINTLKDGQRNTVASQVYYSDDRKSQTSSERRYYANINRNGFPRIEFKWAMTKEKRKYLNII